MVSQAWFGERAEREKAREIIDTLHKGDKVIVAEDGREYEATVEWVGRESSNVESYGAQVSLDKNPVVKKSVTVYSIGAGRNSIRKA